MEAVSLKAIESSPSRVATVSLPMPPFDGTLTVDGADRVQVVPLGAWPVRALMNPRLTWPWREAAKPQAFGNPPRRVLITARFREEAPGELTARIEPRHPDGTVPPATPCAAEIAVVPGQESYHHRDAELYHYLKREDSLRVDAGGRSVEIRAAFRVGDALRYWQWCEAAPVWSGPLSRAWVVGGHIYAGPDDRPITIAELPRLQQLPVYPESSLCAKCLVVVHDDGLIELTAHYANVQGYGLGSLAAGLPVIEIRPGDAASPGPGLDIDEGRVTESGGVYRWQPLDDSRIFLGHQQGNPLAVGVEQSLADHWVDDSEKGFVNGVARSFACRIRPGGTGDAPRRYLADPDWYLRCGEFGVALPALAGRGAGPLQGVADDARAVHLRNRHPDGMSRGGVYRYLDEGPAGRYEFSMDGNEALSLYRAAYLTGSPELYAAAAEAARYIADIAIDHQAFNVHYHGDTPDWKLFSLIYMRFGGLVPAYLESGDPWYLENAEAVANRWIALNRINQPRKNMGRDPEPVEGILALYDATGKDHYFQEAEKIAADTARSLFPDGSWRSGFGVGPYWGINALPGTPWNGSHLLAGLAEFLIRAHPATCPTYADLEAKTLLLIDKLIDEIRRQMPDGVWRSAGGFMFRRYFLPVRFAGDADRLARLDGMIDNIRRAHAAGGEVFYKNGHHCGGYLDGPFVYASLRDGALPWEGADTRRGETERPVLT